MGHIISAIQKPLTPSRLYILLALAQTPHHGYRLKGAINNLSLGSIQLADGSLYPLLTRMFDEGLIEY